MNHSVKKNILKKFCETYKNAPTQRTPEWLLARKYKIGGSEVYDAITKNKEKFLYGKLCNNFTGNRYTRWGNMFEDTIVSIVKKGFIYDGVLEELGGVEGPYGLRYSPDGIGIVCYKGEFYIVLFEFKAPATRIPKDIPLKYLYQISSGMACLPCVDFSIYVDIKFNKVPFADWLSYIDNSTNIKFMGLQILYAPRVSYKQIYYKLGYSDEEEYIRSLLEMFTKDEQKNLYDWGASKDYNRDDIFDSLINIVTNSNLIHVDNNIVYITDDAKKEYRDFEILNPMEFSRQNILSTLNQTIENLKTDNIIIGIVPWIVKHHHIAIVERNDIIEKNSNKILEVYKSLVEHSKEDASKDQSESTYSTESSESDNSKG